jgi:hypothetical protein
MIVFATFHGMEDDGALLGIHNYDAMRVTNAATEKSHLQLTSCGVSRTDDRFGMHGTSLVQKAERARCTLGPRKHTAYAVGLFLCPAAYNT